MADNDIRHLITALGRVRDPMMRYLITQFVDLLTEQVHTLERQTAKLPSKR